MPACCTPDLGAWHEERASLLTALEDLPSPVIFMSNEVGWGVSPLGREVREYVDELGRINQDLARRCAELTMMVAGQAVRTREVRQ